MFKAEKKIQKKKRKKMEIIPGICNFITILYGFGHT